MLCQPFDFDAKLERPQIGRWRRLAQQEVKQKKELFQKELFLRGPKSAGIRCMYIGSKVSKGHTYYQIVEGVRVGTKVVQRVLIPASARTTSDPNAALKNMRRELVELRREFTRQVIRSDRRIENYHRRIKKLDVRIRDLVAYRQAQASAISSTAMHGEREAKGLPRGWARRGAVPGGAIDRTRHD